MVMLASAASQHLLHFESTPAPSGITIAMVALPSLSSRVLPTAYIIVSFTTLAYLYVSCDNRGPEVEQMSDDYLPLMRAAEYIGVSRVKLGQLVKEGAIPYVTSPLDKRVKLFRRADLDVLRRAPRPPQAAGAPARSE